MNPSPISPDQRAKAFQSALRAAQRVEGAKWGIPASETERVCVTLQEVRRQLGFRAKSSLYERPWRGLVEQARREGRLV